jgi:hypothetical protein
MMSDNRLQSAILIVLVLMGGSISGRSGICNTFDRVEWPLNKNQYNHTSQGTRDDTSNTNPRPLTTDLIEQSTSIRGSRTRLATRLGTMAKARGSQGRGRGQFSARGGIGIAPQLPNHPQRPSSDTAATNIPTIIGAEPVNEVTPTDPDPVNVSTSSDPSMSILSLQRTLATV